MRDLWRIIEAVKEKKHMVRIAFFPGGTLNVAIYDSEKQMKQNMYDAHSYEELETMMKKDWGHLLGPSNPNVTVNEWGVFPKVPSIPKLPPIPGFPRP